VADQDHIEVAVIDKTVYLKPFGCATQQNSLGIPDFLRAMYRAGCGYVAFDLLECKGMDSTFLGVIADAATSNPHTGGKSVIIFNASAPILQLLRRIGLLPLVSVHSGRLQPPAPIQLQQIDFVHFPKTEYQKLQTVKRLHEQLVLLNEKSRRLFEPFLTMLEEELQSQRDDVPDE
jgi:hypothetical protein